VLWMPLHSKPKTKHKWLSVLHLRQNVSAHPSPPQFDPQHRGEIEGIFKRRQGADELAAEFEAVFADFLFHRG